MVVRDQEKKSQLARAMDAGNDNTVRSSSATIIVLSDHGIFFLPFSSRTIKACSVRDESSVDGVLLEYDSQCSFWMDSRLHVFYYAPLPSLSTSLFVRGLVFPAVRFPDAEHSSSGEEQGNR